MGDTRFVMACHEEPTTKGIRVLGIWRRRTAAVALLGRFPDEFELRYMREEVHHKRDAVPVSTCELAIGVSVFDDRALTSCGIVIRLLRLE